MIQIRKSNDRGGADHGWLQSKHTFSFADYHDPKHMGFGPLRVINEDLIASGTGFGTHPHRDMEIISYVVAGALEHKDSMGNTAIIHPGEVQRMSAGTGVRHSEYSVSNETTHLLQIWILPETQGIQPSYAQKDFAPILEKNEFTLVASKNGRDGSVTLNQDVDMYVTRSTVAGEKNHETSPQRHLWVQVIHGKVRVDSSILETGDGAGIHQVESIKMTWDAGSEFLLFDMP